MKRSCAVLALTFLVVAIIGNHQTLSAKEVGFQPGSILLKGYIVTTRDNGPLPVVIFMHGGRGSRVGGDPKGIVEAIAKAGFIGFAWIRSHDSSLAGNIQETIIAIDYVKNLKNVDVERLAVIGFSRGGLLAFLASI